MDAPGNGRQWAPRGRGGRGGGRGDRGDRGGGGGGGRGSGRGRGRGRGRGGDARVFDGGDSRRNGAATPPRARGNGGKRGGGGDDGISLDEAFCMSVQKELQALVEDGARFEMSFPTDLDNTQRRYIHSIAEKFGLFSKSSGKGDNRFIHVAKAKKNARMEQVSLRLSPIPVGRLPPVVHTYLSKYPVPPTPTTAMPVVDQWSGMKDSAYTALAPNKATQQRSQGARPLFRPLRRDGSNKQAGNARSAGSSSKASNLPVFSYKQQILELVEANQVVVISGDTGCGKSTQIPQFLLDDAIAKGSINNTRITCTQPRRLSAISLAERVAKERSNGTSNSQEIGHAIRFDSSFSVDKSKLIFCTTGTLLKWLNNDPLALGFSHLILDEVHERDQFTDFLLILLKSSILKQRKDLKVILMSATIQVEKFSAYFQPEYSAPILEMVGGRCFPVTTLFLEDVLALLEAERTAPFVGSTNSNHRQARLTSNCGARTVASDSGLQCPLCGGGGFADAEAFGMHVATCFGEPPADQPPVVEEEIVPAYQENEKPDPADLASLVQHTLGRFDESQKNGLLSAYERQEDALSRDQSVDYDLLLQLLYLIDQQFPLHGSTDSPTSKGAVLVFLPGWEEISFMERALLRSPSTSSKYEIALLHSRLSAQEQRRAFLTPPRGKRKLILATNIAETSLTIEDVVFVVDCGKSKQAHALATTSSSSFVMGLQTTWVARANCVQRTGRAGRVRAGICFRLFSRARYETAMKQFMLPELLTTPLEELMLQIKLLQFERKLRILDAKQFISQAMDAPSELSIDAALQRLTDMNALDRPEGGLTLFGWHLAHICTGGVPVQMGKLVLWSHVLGCFDAVLQTTSALSGYRDPFLNFLGMTAVELRQVEASKEAFVRHACPQLALQSDHFALWKAFEAYVNFPSRSFAQRDGFCARNMLHRPTLEQIYSIYRQLQQDMELLGMTPKTQLIAPSGREHPLHSLTSYLMALSAGMYPNVLFSRSSVSRNWTSKEKVKVKIDGASMVAWLGAGKSKKPGRNSNFNGEDPDEPLEWLVYHEMMQSERTRLAKYATKLPSTLLLVLLMGNPESVQFEDVFGAGDSDEPERRWLLILDDWMVFEFQSMDDSFAVLTIRDRLRAAFYRHLDRLHAGSQRFGGARGQEHGADQSEELLRQHDAELVQALVAWIAADIVA